MFIDLLDVLIIFGITMGIIFLYFEWYFDKEADKRDCYWKSTILYCKGCDKRWEFCTCGKQWVDGKPPYKHPNYRPPTD